MKEKNEIEFSKYKTRGSDYHYRQINKLKVREFNSFVYGRYMKHIKIVGEYIKKINPNKRDFRILDVGCGDGVLLFLISKYFEDIKFDIYGIDASEEALKIANKKNNGKFSKKNVYETGLEDDFFDIIISSDVIEHVSDADKMLGEIKRVSKKGAIIVISTPVKTTEEPLDKMHVHEFYPNEYKDLCKKYFEVLDLEKSHSLLFHLLYETNLVFMRKSVLPFRYLMNFFTYLGFNFFEKSSKSKTERFSYMFAVCLNKK